MRKMKVSLVLLSLVAAVLLNLLFNPSVAARSTENNEDCTSAGKFFQDFEKRSNSKASNQNGSICDGKCCNSHEESLLYDKAGEKLKKMIKTQLKTLRDLWGTSFITYKERLSDLVNHSENRTLHLFLTVYQRMFPLTKQPITELYESIRSHINTKPSQEHGLEPAIEVFFKNLFPIAYHHAVESHDIKFMEELSVDYKSCLKKNYEYLKPFGDIPHITSRLLTQYIGSSNIFLRALDEAGRIVNDIERFATNNISPSCQKALLKMDYCAQCKGYADSRPCRSYCSNVLSGCLTFFSNGFENNWSAFVETMENLVASRNKETFDKSIKTLDGKLSEAIMYAMTNGPELEKKVNSACGNHGTKSNRQKISSTHSESIESITLGSPKLQPNNLKWASPPPDTEILLLLSNLERFKKFSLQMANQYCENDSYKIDDVHCWNSENIGKYLQPIVDIYSQKYNPEIPELQNLNDNKDFNELNDRLLSSRSSINKQIASLKYESDKMFSDMAPTLDDGSTEDDEFDTDDRDDFDYSGSGDDRNRDIPITPGVDVTIPNRKTTTSTSGALKETSWHVSILMMIFTLSCFRYLEVCD